MVTAWRLTRDNVGCQAIVMDGPAGVRLVVIEDQQIVQWERFSRIHQLRTYVTKALTDRRNAGWVPCTEPASTPTSTRNARPTLRGSATLFP